MRLSASPTIVNCRSTAERSSASTVYSTNDSPARNASSSRQARGISYRYFNASSRIQHHPIRGDRAEEVGVADGPRFHQIDVTAKEIRQREEQAEIAMGMLRRRNCVELDEEVQVARLGIEAVAGRRAE